MTEAQQALILKHQANTPTTYHHIINHLVLTEEYAAASLLTATLEQQAEIYKDTIPIRLIDKYSLEYKIDHLEDEFKKLHYECDMLRMQSSGFQERMEQLLEENANLKSQLRI